MKPIGPEKANFAKGTDDEDDEEEQLQNSVHDKDERPSSGNAETDSDKVEVTNVLEFFKGAILTLHGPLRSRDGQKQFQEFHMCDVFAKCVVEKSRGACDQDKKGVVRDMSLHADNYYLMDATHALHQRVTELNKAHDRLSHMMKVGTVFF